MTGDARPAPLQEPNPPGVSCPSGEPDPENDQIEVREVGAGAPEDVALLCSLYQAWMPWARGVLAQLFLKRVFLGFFVDHNLARAVLCLRRGRPVAFAVYSLRPGEYLRAILWRHRLIAVVTLAVFWCAPLCGSGQIADMVRTMLARRPYQGRRWEPSGAVLTVSAHPELEKREPTVFLAAEHSVLQHLVTQFEQAGIELIRANSQQSLPWRRLAARQGWDSWQEEAAGSFANPTVWLHLPLAEFESERAIPAAWSVKNFPDDTAKGWRVAWEAFDDRHPVYRFEAAAFVDKLDELVRPEPSWRVLDFGCGFGFVAEQLAARVQEVHLWDLAGNVRRRARVNLAHVPNARYFDPGLPAEVRFDLIVVNSVVQYMSQEEFLSWLPRWRAWLAPGGRIVLSDLIPSRHSLWKDTREVLAFSRRHGLLLQDLGDRLSLLMHYGKAASKHPLLRHDRVELELHAAAAGMRLEVAPENLTARSGRWTAVLCPVGAQG